MTDFETLVRCIPRGYKLCHDPQGTWSIVGPDGDWPALDGTPRGALEEMVQELKIDPSTIDVKQLEEDDAQAFERWINGVAIAHAGNVYTITNEQHAEIQRAYYAMCEAEAAMESGSHDGLIGAFAAAGIRGLTKDEARTLGAEVC